VLPSKPKEANTKGKAPEQQNTTEYSSREVKPAILLLGDLLRAHSTFLLHHAASMSALFVRTKRSKFIGILSRYWDTFLSTWNVLMHGNPANNLYGGIKIAACGELGVGVGEEERGSGEREVLEGFVGRISGLVDVIVSKFGDADSKVDTQVGIGKKDVPVEPWLGSGNDPGAEDGVVFLGTGALSRKSLRDVSHWVEDLYRWGPYAYGVLDNPTSTRRAKKSKAKPKKELSPVAKNNARQVYGLASLPDDSSPKDDSLAKIPPMPMNDGEEGCNKSKGKLRRPSLRRGPSSHTSTDSDSSKSNALVRYLKFGYGTHWSLGGSIGKTQYRQDTPPQTNSTQNMNSVPENPTGNTPPVSEVTAAEVFTQSRNDSGGHYLIGLMGDIENDLDDEEPVEDAPEDSSKERPLLNNGNTRLVLRTLTLESEREEDARAKADISIDLGNNGHDKVTSKHTGSEHTATSSTSFESQDRNKTKKLRVVVYVNRPFVFVFLFELRTDALAFKSLYRSLHYQISPLLKPLLSSTTFRASKPEVAPSTMDKAADSPIYDLVWDPMLLTVNSTIPNIPDPFQPTSQSPVVSPWSRIEALNTHMQIITTYIATTKGEVEMERTSKTSRGWWVVWTRIPASAPEPPLASSPVKVPGLITEDSAESNTNVLIVPDKSRASTFGGSSLISGPAHPFLDIPSNSQEGLPKDKEIFLVRQASDHMPSMATSRFVSSSAPTRETGWGSGPSKLAQGIGVDTKRYIESLLDLNR